MAALHVAAMGMLDSGSLRKENRTTIMIAQVPNKVAKFIVSDRQLRFMVCVY